MSVDFTAKFFYGIPVDDYAWYASRLFDEEIKDTRPSKWWRFW